jgi:plastocyanin
MPMPFRRSRGTRLLLSTAIVALVLAPAAVAQASGGGGCGGPVTEAAGTHVDIERFCYTPTVIRAPVGEQVTWTNLDRVPHMVGGANMVWGSFETLRRGDTTSFSFSEPGVYPYVCSWHPGMVGAVVVGDAAAGKAVEPESVAASSASAGAATPWKIIAAVAIGLFAVTLAAGLELRRRVSRER